MHFNTTCNSTLDDLRILPTSEVKVAGNLTFHDIALIVAGATTIFSILCSFSLIWMHALHYTKPNEQKHIIRILFMVPVYAVASFLALEFYWHAIYYQVISDCYEAFAIASFFALLCAYVAPDVHEQKNYFRDLRNVKPWVLPVNWMASCCGGQRGPWRTPASGLTWFNIIWIGIYHYCFIRVAMTITAVVTQYFGRYCESSNNPVFSHIWVIVLEALAVTIAMYCVIQFYVQLRVPLAEHRPFLKVLAIKLVIFLSFWQTAAISVGTSTLHLVKANSVLAYPDIKVGIPSLLLCIEMAIFSVLHIWAFPYSPYRDNARPTFYPVADPNGPHSTPKQNEHLPRSGGFMGLRAIWDAANIWDVVKAFGRGMRWLFVGVHRRREDISYQHPYKNAEMDLDDLSAQNYNKQGNTTTGVVSGDVDTAYHHAAGSPVATEFQPGVSASAGAGTNTIVYGQGVSDNYGQIRGGATPANAPSIDSAAVQQPSPGVRQRSDEAAGLMQYAQPMPGNPTAYSSNPGRQYGNSPQVYRGQQPTEDTDVYQEAGTYEESQYGQGGRGRYGQNQGSNAQWGQAR